MGLQVTEVQKSLKGFDYPRSPDQLAQHAEDNGANTELVEALRGLQKGRWDGSRRGLVGIQSVRDHGGRADHRPATDR
ncbi:MAG: DUF2795 domain-containing protein [Actinomycetota bacterium]|nr:DUF2795 domain-containing protein [Actinomycetota bacterium]